MSNLVYIALTVLIISRCLKGAKEGVAALAFVFPIAARLPSLPIPLLNTENLLILAAMFSLLVGRGKETSFGKIRFIIPILTFLTFVTVALITALNYEPTTFLRFWDPHRIITNYKTLLFCFLIYVLGCLVGKTKEDLIYVVKGILYGALVESGFIFYEVLVRGPARANGHLGEGNSAGAYLAWTFMVSLGLILTRGYKDKLGRLALAVSALSAYGLLFTMSRGNWMAAIMGGMALGVVKDRRFLILLVVAVVGYQFWLPDRFVGRIEESVSSQEGQSHQIRVGELSDEADAVHKIQGLIFGEEIGYSDDSVRLDSSSQIRLFVWQAAIHMSMDNPFGVGLGLFQFYLGDYSAVYKFRAAHNTYLLLAAEAGIPTLFFFLLFLGLILTESLVAYAGAGDNELKAIALANFAALISMMISAGFYSFFFLPSINGQQWLFAGMAMQVLRLARRSEASETVPQTATKEIPDSAPVPLYKLVR